MTVAYHQTTALTPQQARDYERAASTQDAVVLEVFHASAGPLTPSQVWARCSREGRNWPLTSIRRAISNLTRDGALVKLDFVQNGPWGRPESMWQVAERQTLLFGRPA